MDSILNFLNQGWIGSLLGVLGIGFGIYQVVRRTEARLVYQYIGQQLIESDHGLLPNEVVVQFDGKKVPRLSLSQIIIWNNGRKAIRGEDITPKDPIKFSFGDDAEILKAEILKFTRAANESRTSIEEKNRQDVLYQFSFLNHGDGALIRILHTGRQTWPHCFGTLIGPSKGVESFGKIYTNFHWPLYLDFSSGFVASFSIFFALFPKFFERLIRITFMMGEEIISVTDVPYTVTSTEMRITLGFLGIFLFCYVIFLHWIRRRRFPSALTPDELVVKGKS